MTTLENILLDLEAFSKNNECEPIHRVDDQGDGWVVVCIEGFYVGMEVSLGFEHGKLQWVTGCCNPKHGT